MSTTDELLEEMLEDAEEYATPVADDDLQFWIDEHLRVISIPKNGVVAGVEGDKNVNKIKFGMNRYYHGFDMSEFSGRILYSNAKGNKNYYNITDMQTSGNIITFSWLVDADTVQYMGKTAFVVYLFKHQGSELRQKFYSTLATLKVLEGMEVDSAVPVEKQTDIIERMKEEISAYAEEVKKSLPADYTAMTEQVSSLKEDIDKYCGVSKPVYSLKKNTYINIEGYISQEGYVTSNPIPVNANDIVKLTATGYLTNIVMINMCDESGNLSLLPNDRCWSIDSTHRDYTFIVPQKGYVVVSGATSTLYLKILTGISNLVLKNGVESANNIIQESNLTPLSITKFKSGYIASDGSVGIGNNCVYSEPVKLYRGQIVKSLVQGYLADISLVSEYNADGTYTPLVISTDNNKKTLVYKIKSDGNYVFSTLTSVAYDYKVYIDCATLLQPQETTNFMTIFHKLGVIGDSLSSGEIVRNNEYIDRYNFSWLSNIGRRNGLKCEHYSQGGMTAKNWLNNTGSLYDKFQNDDELASALFIALGTNDISAGYPVGNSKDEAGTDSFCGYIKRIIETIRTKNPNCVIFMVSLYCLSDKCKIYSDAIRDLSKLYNLCYFVNYADNSDGVVADSTDWCISRYGHFTTTSYVKVSNIIEKLCNDIVKNHQSEFGYFGLDNN